MKCILICPECKTRYTVEYDEWCRGLLPGGTKPICTNVLCSNKMLVYHKDV
jgi:hypothetical protein